MKFCTFDSEAGRAITRAWGEKMRPEIDRAIADVGDHQFLRKLCESQAMAVSDALSPDYSLDRHRELLSGSYRSVIGRVGRSALLAGMANRDGNPSK